LLLDAVASGQDLVAATLEPGGLSDKFDFVWEDAQGTRAVQVKSTDKQFSRADVERWAVELQSTGQASDYVLCLVGLIPLSLARISSLGRVRLDFHNLDLMAVREQAAHRLDRFLRSQRMLPGSPDYREMLVEALTSRLLGLSVTGTRATHPTGQRFC